MSGSFAGVVAARLWIRDSQDIRVALNGTARSLMMDLSSSSHSQRYARRKRAAAAPQDHLQDPEQGRVMMSENVLERVEGGEWSYGGSTAHCPIALPEIRHSLSVSSSTVFPVPETSSRNNLTSGKSAVMRNPVPR